LLFGERQFRISGALSFSGDSTYLRYHLVSGWVEVDSALQRIRSLTSQIHFLRRCNERFDIPLLFETAQKARFAISETLRCESQLLCQHFSMNRELFH
jgi:hypothetical protein